MNQNLMNPEIVMRSTREREMDLRREMRGLNNVELNSSKPGRKARAQQTRRTSVLAWIFATIAR